MFKENKIKSEVSKGVGKQSGFSLIAILVIMLALIFIIAKYNEKFGQFFGAPATSDDVQNVPGIKERTDQLEKNIQDRYPGN